MNFLSRVKITIIVVHQVVLSKIMNYPTNWFYVEIKVKLPLSSILFWASLLTMAFSTEEARPRVEESMENSIYLIHCTQIV